MASIIIEWNGTAVPDGLRDLPPGRYHLEPLDEPLLLTAEEEAGLMRAMDELDAGRGRPLEGALSRVRTSLEEE